MRPVIIAAALVIVTLLSFQNCSNHLVTPNTPVVDYSSVQAIAPDCEFNGTGLMNGDTVRAYLSSTVPVGQMCLSEVRSCQNGKLSGNFEYAFCLPGAPNACLIDGRTIPSGGSIKVYESASVVNGLNCEDFSQVRTCNNGILSGTYTVTKCVTQKAKDCNFNGIIIPDGTPRRFFKYSSVPYLGDCIAELRVCTNGSLSGSYTFSSCQPQQAVGCNVNGTPMSNGQTRPFYNVNTVEFGKTCPAPISRNCDNGTVSGDANYKFASCAPTSASSCLFNGNVTVEHDKTVDAWQVASVPYGEDCEPKKEVRKCTNGVLSGSFRFPSCQPGNPSLTCTTLDGVVMSHGQSELVFKANLIQPPGDCASNGNAETAFCDNGTLKSGNINGAPLSSNRYFKCLTAGLQTTQWEGNEGSNNPNVSCLSGRVSGLFYGADHRNEDIDSFGVLCTSGSNRIVGTSQANPVFSYCPANKYVVGVFGQSQGWFSFGQTMCANPDGSGIEFINPSKGWSHPGENPTWYQVCQPGYVLTKLSVRTGGTVEGFNMECTQIAMPANQNCEGDWINQGCQNNSHYPMNTEKFYYKKHQGGTGTACATPNLTTKAGTIDCTPPPFDPFGNGGGGPGDGG